LGGPARKGKPIKEGRKKKNKENNKYGKIARTI